MTLTKVELAAALHRKLGLGQREAMELVIAFFDEISSGLARRDKVKLSGFGTFRLREKTERPGRNPRTGQAVAVCARRVVTFGPSRGLKALEQDGSSQGLASRGRG